DCVFKGPIVGPLNKVDYCNTQAMFRIYRAFPDLEMEFSEFTVDPIEPMRYWGIMRVQGTQTGALNLGGLKVPANGNKMVVGPQSCSVTFNEKKEVIEFTGGYVVDSVASPLGSLGFAFAVLKNAGIRPPGGPLLKLSRRFGDSRKNYTKSVSHVDDLPDKWKPYGRKYGPRSRDAWDNYENYADEWLTP
ncbi:hypothetical protein JKP88DRAFT_181384, partial [Tribonema minus]